MCASESVCLCLCVCVCVCVCVRACVSVCDIAGNAGEKEEW